MTPPSRVVEEVERHLDELDAALRQERSAPSALRRRWRIPSVDGWALDAVAVRQSAGKKETSVLVTVSARRWFHTVSRSRVVTVRRGG